MFAWVDFVGKWANVKKPIDWEDLEERSHFLNTLYVWCEKNLTPFPLEKTLNFSEDNTASEANGGEEIPSANEMPLSHEQVEEMIEEEYEREYRQAEGEI